VKYYKSRFSFRHCFVVFSYLTRPRSQSHCQEQHQQTSTNKRVFSGKRGKNGEKEVGAASNLNKQAPFL